MAGLLSREEIAAAYKAALDRKKTGRRQEYQSHTEAERRLAWVEARELPRSNLHAPEWRDAENLGEWLDDRVIEWAHAAACPEAPLMITLAEAARDSTAEALKALRAARDLPAAVQWNVFQNLGKWDRADDRGRTLGDRLAAALLGEWSRLKLPEKDPAATQQAKRRQRHWERTEMEATA